MPGALRLTRRFVYAVLWSGLGLASILSPSAAASDVTLVGHELIRIRWPHEHARPHEDLSYGILALTPLSRNRYLAVLTKETSTWDQWIDEEQALREAREHGVVTSYSPKVQSELTLAVIGRNGKVLDVGESNLVANNAIGLADIDSAIPLVMDMEPSCPYALLDAGQRRLACFDYELGFLREIKIPLDEITSARVTYDGKHYTVWVLGRGYGEHSPEGKSLKKPATTLEDLPVVQPLVLGVKLRVGEEEQWEPVPLDVDELSAELQRIARGPDGDKVVVSKNSITVRAFGDTTDYEPFWVLVEAVASDKYESRVSFSGTRLYFRGRLDSAGLSQLRQLAFWIQQADTESSPNINYDEETGVMKLPNPVWLVKMRQYSVAKNEMVLYFSPIYGHASFGGKKIGHFANHVFLYFDDVSSPPKLFPIQDDQWLDELAASLIENRGLVVPFWLLGQVKRDEFVFRCFCSEKRRKKGEKPQYCIAVLGIEWH